MATEPEFSHVPVAAIILAAGASTRMGRPKQLLLIDGQPMVRRVAEAVCAAGLAQVVVVVGAGAAEVGRALAGLPVEVVMNPAWAEGMSASLRAGLAALRPEVGAALIVLADQPGMTAALIGAVVERYRASRAPIVAPFHGPRRGSPVLFDRALFAELMAIEGDEGGRQIVARYLDRMVRVDVQDPAALADIDTYQDYERLTHGQRTDNDN